MRWPVVACLLLAGCFGQRGTIRTPQGTVIGVPDAGKPASLASQTVTESLPIPEGSTLTVTKHEASPATANTPAQPASEQTEIRLAKPSEWKRGSVSVQADTGTVDTSIAKHRIDAAENRFLLYAALGAVVASGVFLYLKYPTPAFICAGAAVVFFLAWKLADLPAWFWVIGAAGAAGAVFLYLGHEQGEKSVANQAAS